MKTKFLLKTFFIFSLFLGSIHALEFNLSIEPSNLETIKDGQSIAFIGNVNYPVAPDENVTISCYSHNTQEATCNNLFPLTFPSGLLSYPFNIIIEPRASRTDSDTVSYTKPYDVTFTTEKINYDEKQTFDPATSITYTITSFNNWTIVTPPPPPPSTDKIVLTQYNTGTSEDGDFTLLKLVLQQEPTGDVSINVNSSDLTEASVSVNSLIFTSENWDTPQNIRVQGIDDPILDGSIEFTIDFSLASSSDSYYSGYSISNISLFNTDNEETPIPDTIIIEALDSSQTTEDGGIAKYSISLSSQPSTDVNISIDQAFGSLILPGHIDDTEFSLSKRSFLFTNSTWNIEQTLTITGLDDLLYDGNISQSIIFNYNNTYSTSLSVTNIDNEVGKAVIYTVNGNTSESGQTAEISILLRKAPTHNLVYTFESLDDTECQITNNTLSFSPIDWDTPKSIMVSGVDDDILDFDQICRVQITNNAIDEDLKIPSIDEYSPLRYHYQFIVNEDNEDSDSLISIRVTDTTTSTLGDTANFSVKLNQMPEDTVEVSVQSTDTSLGYISTPSNKSILFTKDNWNISQNVIVKGVTNSDITTPNHYAINFTVSAQVDKAFNISPLPLLNLDKTKPSNYTAEFNVQNVLQTKDATNVSITIDGAEVGTTYFYTISSSSIKNNTAITGSGTIISATQIIALDNLNILDDGVLTLELSLRDSSNNIGGKVTDTLLLDIVNDAPLVSIDDDKTRLENTDSSFTFITSDFNGDLVSATIKSNPIYGSIILTGNDVTYTPTTDYSGPDSFTISFSDGNGGITDKTINILVSSLNDEPTIVIENILIVKDDGSISIVFSYTDMDGDVFSTAIISSPNHGLANIEGTDITYIPDTDYIGNDKLTISLSDSSGSVTIKDVNILVLEKTILIDIVNQADKTVLNEVITSDLNNIKTIMTTFENATKELSTIKTILPKNAQIIFTEYDASAYVVYGEVLDDKTTLKTITLTHTNGKSEVIQVFTDENNNSIFSQIITNREHVGVVVLDDASVEVTSEFISENSTHSTTNVLLKTDGSTQSNSTFINKNGESNSLTIQSNILGIITELKDNGSTKFTSPKIVSTNGKTTEIILDITAEGLVRPIMILTDNNGKQKVVKLPEITVNKDLELDISIVKLPNGSVTFKMKSLIPDNGIRRKI